ncbi:transposase [Nitrosomonas sp.]|uniref:IS66 family transposase n=1 Tax=Nitrosomonas sp. TaxID=42353 RepID=UPI0035CCEF92
MQALSETLETGCWAHVRRKFLDLHKAKESFIKNFEFIFRKSDANIQPLTPFT